MFSRNILRINESKLCGNISLFDEFVYILNNVYNYTLDDLNKKIYYEFRL